MIIGEESDKNIHLLNNEDVEITSISLGKHMIKNNSPHRLFMPDYFIIEGGEGSQEKVLPPLIINSDQTIEVEGFCGDISKAITGLLGPQIILLPHFFDISEKINILAEFIDRFEQYERDIGYIELIQKDLMNHFPKSESISTSGGSVRVTTKTGHLIIDSIDYEMNNFYTNELIAPKFRDAVISNPYTMNIAAFIYRFEYIGLIKVLQKFIKSLNQKVPREGEVVHQIRKLVNFRDYLLNLTQMEYLTYARKYILHLFRHLDDNFQDEDCRDKDFQNVLWTWIADKLKNKRTTSIMEGFMKMKKEIFIFPPFREKEIGMRFEIGKFEYVYYFPNYKSWHEYRPLLEFQVYLLLHYRKDLSIKTNIVNNPEKAIQRDKDQYFMKREINDITEKY